MSHDSGFRRGSRDFSRKGGPPRQKRQRGGKAFERRMAERFHEHEKEAQEHKADETETTEEPDEG